MKKTSYITGEAVVVFGGAIGIGLAYNPEEKKVGILFSELKEQLNVGDKVEEEETYEEQVQFVFDNLESIKMVRRALDLAERTLKDGEIPRKGGEE